ncbi:MAG: hypothetical protein U9P42_05580, partial [Candidatus Fermentibacteria bacterium]|nr:hypothetical protein [Candidatus Fermentibacteria bacterium]
LNDIPELVKEFLLWLIGVQTCIASRSDIKFLWERIRKCTFLLLPASTVKVGSAVFEATNQFVRTEQVPELFGAVCV